MKKRNEIKRKNNIKVANNNSEINDNVAYEVFRTTDYDKFSYLETNRDIKETRINKILDSIADIGLRRVPIVVNEKMEVIDGQGRLEALKSLGMPVDYVIDKGADVDVCRRLNIGQTNWKPIDYVNSFAKEGNKNYQNLVYLLETYKMLPLQTIVGVCEGQIVHDGRQATALKNGNFELDNDKMKNVIQTLDFLVSVKNELMQIRGSLRIIFTMFGWIINQDGVDVDRIKKIITEKSPLLIPSIDIVSSLTQVSDLYNKGLKDKSKRKYFEILYKESK